MKSLYLRSSVALACALGLAACGGGDDNLLLGGNVFGLLKNGLVIQNNGGPDLAIPAGSTGFSFPQLISSDSDFNVTVKAQPSSTVCTVVNGKGKSGAYSVYSVEIHCITSSYDLGGTVSGLDVPGLVLINGSQRVTILPGATSFTMTKFKNDDGKTYESGRVPDGQPYGITILQQPTGRTCRVANGVGTMGNTAVKNVAVTCS
ncbi:hypothetical protein HHL21_10235 [Massilia sp. RP-1-19]|uniref:Lipoprotein n=1 Tax=Massilia polaris TaxID=2728846 RepID=A0A848HS39_9BURK|nr:hypothetical protein [Massilia polaris]NML61448.1 hypothetical protein [Massilia polaris]